MKLTKLEITLPSNKVADVVALLVGDAISLSMTPVEGEAPALAPEKRPWKQKTPEQARKYIKEWRCAQPLLEYVKDWHAASSPITSNPFSEPVCAVTVPALKKLMTTHNFSPATASTIRSLFVRAGYAHIDSKGGPLILDVAKLRSAKLV